MMLVIPFLVLLGIAAGPLLACVKSTPIRRSAGWLLLISLTVSSHFILLENGAFLRMVGICCVLLGGMKGLVYAEWAGKEKLSLSRYAIFSFLWFGMDPGTFRFRNPKLRWKNDIAIGSLLVVIGLSGSWLVANLGWKHIFIMFLPLSLAFHFGFLRILKGSLRAFGFPVRTLFPNLLATTGVADFWSRRWNIGYSQMMQRLVGRPIESIAGKSTAVMAVFISSGLLHELAITLPVMSGFGLPTLYFTLHGLLTLIEQRFKRPFGKIPALISVILPLGWLFPSKFQTEVIEKCLSVF
ncbi:MAG: membrane bound O-acyl transferase family-domain-containing protein [Akkermansiaceae bacterium]|jgi:alginate O-acetyltransferase complex protein AlgI|nr:membrane bound O-acyl transferase family-domain-containing protein [Akkermansiaceae bacterium]